MRTLSENLRPGLMPRETCSAAGIIVTINTAHGPFSFLSHTYSTSFPHLLHYDSYLSRS